MLFFFVALFWRKTRESNYSIVKKRGGKGKRGQLEGVRDGDHQFAVACVAEASAVACVYVVAC